MLVEGQGIVFRTRVRLPSSPLKRNNPQTSMSGAFASDIIHGNRMLAERAFYCFAAIVKPPDATSLLWTAKAS